MMIAVVYVYLMWVVFRGYFFNIMLFMQLTPVLILCITQTSLKPFCCSRLSHVDTFSLVLSICQFLCLVVFVMASFNYIILILLMVAMGCKCWQKLKCKLGRERSHGHSHVIIPSHEEDDKMRQAILILAD